MRKRVAALSICMMLAVFTALAASVREPADAAKILHGLDDLQIISSEQARQFPASSGAVEITLDGECLPYDAAANAYLIPQDALTAGFDGVVELEREEGHCYYICPSAEGGKTEALAGMLEYGIYGICGDVCRSSRLVFTPQPVLCVATDSGELPGEEDANGVLHIYSAQDRRIVRESVRIEINERGNTSRRLPKKSFRIHTIDARGENFHVDIAGLRSDDDWILNPLYADTSKIRESLAYELWTAFNSSGKRAASSRLAHVEVFLNGDYWGLYGLQERVDLKQVDGDKRADLFYKIVSNDRPSAQELLQSQSSERCSAFELQNGKTSRAKNLWMPAAAYMNMLDGQETSQMMLNNHNVVDYGLWAMFTQAHDNHFKNQFLNCVYAGGIYTAYKIPWDTNNTFGDVWNGEDVENNFAEYRIGALVMDGAFQVFLDAGGMDARQMVSARWSQLRATAVDSEIILARARALHAGIQGARMRDSLRWPMCGMGEGNAMNIRGIEHFIETMIERMDAYTEDLLAE